MGVQRRWCRGGDQLPHGGKTVFLNSFDLRLTFPQGMTGEHQQWIGHLDADAFFASVEQAADPRLRGKAMAVGGSKRGIISSASYEARARGVYTPMPTSQALRVCPELLLTRSTSGRYGWFSDALFSIVEDFSPTVERASIDEGYFVLRDTEETTAAGLAGRIRAEIALRLRIDVSIGLASNKLVSQVASKLRKPRGFVVVPHGTEREFLAPIPITRLPGYGRQAGDRLTAAGFGTFGEVAGADPGRLALVVGSGAEGLIRRARGEDGRRVGVGESSRRSYGHQRTLREDEGDPARLRRIARMLADKSLSRLRRDGSMARTLALTARGGEGQDVVRSITFEDGAQSPSEIYPGLDRLLARVPRSSLPARMLRVTLGGIIPLGGSQALLPSYAAEAETSGTLHDAIDGLRDRFGERAAMRGHALGDEGVPDVGVTASPRQKVMTHSGGQDPRSGERLQAEHLLVDLRIPSAKAAEGDLKGLGEAPGLVDGDGGRLADRVAEDPRADGGKGDAPDLRVVAGDSEGVRVAGAEEVGLSALPVAPDRSDGMNDIPRRKQVAAGQFRLPGSAASEDPTLVKEFGSRRPMDGPVHPAATEERRVCGVDDGVDLQGGDVGSDDLHGYSSGSFRYSSGTFPVRDLRNSSMRRVSRKPRSVPRS